MSSSMKARKLVENYLLKEESGFIEPDQYEKTCQITQSEIIDSLDIGSASKGFQLNLDYGEYRLDYFRNGRNLLMGGRQGHVAAFDWMTKELTCEFNVRESVHDVCWLQLPKRFAVAQKDWVHVYDDRGTELNVVKRLYNVNRLEFLPYHMLLGAISEHNFISWLDVSTGQIVKHYRPTKLSKMTSLCQNPCNAVLSTSHSNGVVAMWTPNLEEPAMKMLCHGCPVNDLSIDRTGNYLITAAVDNRMSIWDLRTCKALYTYHLKAVPQHLSISQRNMVAVALKHRVLIFKDVFSTFSKTPYLIHRGEDHSSKVGSLEFCNYEDILGIGHAKGLVSVIVPGAGEPNFDSFEANPFMTGSQAREAEVKQLLDKIPSELITLEPNKFTKLNADLKAASNNWVFKPIDLLTQFDKKYGSKTIKLSKDKKGKILDLIRAEKVANVKRFQNRRQKHKKSRFASKNRSKAKKVGEK